MCDIGSSAPAPPDYVGAAKTQAAASRELTDVQNFANRPTQNTPFGTISWDSQAVIDPATGAPVTQWTQNTTLAPGLQSALDSQIGLQNNRSQLAGGFMQRVANEYSEPFDWNSLPSMRMANPASLQTGLSDYAPGLMSNVNSRSQNIVSGFDFAGPRMSVSPMTEGIASTTQNTPLFRGIDPMSDQLQRSTERSQLQTSFDPMTSNLTANVSQRPVQTEFDSNTQSLAPTTRQESLQRSLATADNPGLPQFDSSYRDSVAQSLLERMVPLQERQQRQLETKLSNQGFQQGSEAYRRALDELNMRQSAERFNALDVAGNEAQRLFNMGLGARQQAFNEDVTGGQFANQAAQAAFNQGLAANQFQNQSAGQAFNQATQAQQAANQAQQQAFNQALASGQFGNQAVQQAYAQALGAGQASNQARQQQFNQDLAADQFANQATQQAYNQNLGAAQFANQAAAQAFNQGLAGNQFQNQANQQAFNQTLGASNFGNQAQQQAYNQMLGLANLNNQAAQQGFNQDLQAAQFGNQALGQASALDIARLNAMNNAMSQQFNMNQQSAQLQNQLRQQAIAEQAQRRGMSLNEMNALLSGQQVSMPQFPGFNPASRAETPNILGATQMGYDAQLGAYNAQQAQNANMMGGAFGLGAAALSNPYMTAFMFSDRRLKSNVKRVGTHAIGVGLYEFTVLGVTQVGVLAQEVQAVRPDLVKRHANGFLMVDYGGL